MYKYKRNMTILLLCNVIILTAWLNLKELQVNRVASTMAFQIEFMEDCAEMDESSFIGMVAEASSGQRVVDYNVLERKAKYVLSEEDYEVLRGRCWWPGWS